MHPPSPNMAGVIDTPKATSQRLVSLDAFRGFIMIVLSFGGFGLAKTAELHLKVDPDSRLWSSVIHQFEHGEWVGWGFWDLIMPAFMFMVGMALPFSLSRRLQEGHSRVKLFGHILVRSIILILLGVFLGNHRSEKNAWTLVNTLSQIGLCYPLVFLLRGRGFKAQAIAASASIIVTWVIFVLHGGSAELGPGITPEWAAKYQAGIGQAWWKCSNVAHYFDVWFLNLFPRSVPFVVQDGGYQTLNFLPSLATMFAGLMCGEWVRLDGISEVKKLRVLLIAGFCVVLAGLIFGHSGFCPIIKRIWTPSFALICTGCCTVMLAFFYGIVEVCGFRRWAFPLVVAGSNSLALYLMGQLLKSWVGDLWVRYLGKDVFRIAGLLWEPTVKATAIGLTFWLVCYWMWRNRFFVRI